MFPSKPPDGPRGSALSRRQLLAGAAAASLLGACGRNTLSPGVPPPVLGGNGYDGPKVELAFWNGFTGGDAPSMRKLVADFNASHPNITVVMNAIRWDDFYRKVPIAVSCGKGPDIGVIHQHQLSSSAARGVVVPLDALADSFGLREQDFFPRAWKGGIYQGQRYGIPLDVHPLGMFYNKGAFEKAGIQAPPATGEELIEALARLKKSGMEYPFWMPTQWPAHFMFESLLWQFGGDPFSADATQATFASDAGVQAIQWMTGMSRQGYSPTSIGLDGHWNAFTNGTNAIAWDGVWMVHNVSNVPGGAGVAPLPRIGSQPAAWGNSHHLVIFGRPGLDARRVQAGMVFLDWLTQHSLEWARAGQVPARTSVRESAEFAALPAQATFAQQLPHVRLLPTEPGIGDLQDATMLFAVASALRAEEPRESLESVQRLANDQLRIFREQYRR